MPIAGKVVMISNVIKLTKNFIRKKIKPGPSWQVAVPEFDFSFV
jgi:hypothetical protein